MPAGAKASTMVGMGSARRKATPAPISAMVVAPNRTTTLDASMILVRRVRNSRRNWTPSEAPMRICAGMRTRSGMRPSARPMNPNAIPTAIAPMNQALGNVNAAKAAPPTAAAASSTRAIGHPIVSPGTSDCPPAWENWMTRNGATATISPTRRVCESMIGSSSALYRGAILTISATPPGTVAKNAVVLSRCASRISSKAPHAPTTIETSATAPITCSSESSVRMTALLNCTPMAEPMTTWPTVRPWRIGLIGAPNSPTSAVANSEPSNHGSGSPPSRAMNAPTTAATNVAAAAAARPNGVDFGRTETGAVSFIAPRINARGRYACLAFAERTVNTRSGGRLRRAHMRGKRQWLVGAGEKLDRHEHHLLVAEVLEIVHLALSRPVRLVAGLARLIGVFDSGSVMDMLAAAASRDRGPKIVENVAVKAEPLAGGKPDHPYADAVAFRHQCVADARIGILGFALELGRDVGRPCALVRTHCRLVHH